MSIQEWMDSDPMRQARLSMFGDKHNSFCTRCYIEEDHSTTSRRHRSNQKSVLFTRTNFNASYLQSPGYERFERSRTEDGAYDGMPIDLHIDLGNYCNLACKMCNPRASSNIAFQYKKWDIHGAEKYIGTDWTRDQEVWLRVLDELADIHNLKNIHFMGGETLITKRFEEFVDFMIDRGRFDINFSFVTNGTTFNSNLLEKLMKFQRTGIEVSIETTTDHNAYQRQGTDTKKVIENIDRYIDFCDNDRVTLTVRPAVSLLTIGNYPTLLEFCLTKKLMIKSLLCYNPSYLDARILPREIKNLYIGRYQEILSKYKLDDVDTSIDYNESDPNQLDRTIKNQIIQCTNVLKASEPPDAQQRLAELVSWCRRWDDLYGYDARELYPEFQSILDQYEY